MRIKLEYTAQLKRAAAVAAETFEVDEGITLQQIVGNAAENRGEEFQAALFGEGNDLHPSILIFVNNLQVQWSDPLVLHDGSVITLVSPISGG